VLERALEFIEELHLAEVTGSDIEILTLPYEASGHLQVEDEAEEQP
jgi:hypothetical protein